jgi:hypothetical protein
MFYFFCIEITLKELQCQETLLKIKVLAVLKSGNLIVLKKGVGRQGAIAIV